MNHTQTITKCLPVRAYVQQGLFLTALEKVLNVVVWAIRQGKDSAPETM
jgi:hypothetical protein